MSEVQGKPGLWCPGREKRRLRINRGLRQVCWSWKLTEICKKRGDCQYLPPKEANLTEKRLKVKLQSLQEHILQDTIFTNIQTLSGKHAEASGIYSH